MAGQSPAATIEAMDMADSGSDPFDWSVDRVVYELCRNPQPVWPSNTNRPLVTNPAAFGVALRTNDIDGELLLAGLTPEVLKNELGVMSLGQRYHIMTAIEYLRNLSQKYRTPQRDQAASFQRSSPIIGRDFMSRQIKQSNGSVYPFLHGSLPSPNTPPSKQTIPDAPRCLPQADVQTHPAQTETERQEETASSTRVITVAAAAQNKLESGVPGLRKDRYTLAGGGAITGFSQYTTHDGRKRLAPTLVSHISGTAVPTQSDSVDECAQFYLGRHGFRVFYRDNFTDEDESKHFTFIQSGHPKGQSLHVLRRMKYFYQQPVQQLPDSEACAKTPYRRPMLNPGDPQHFTTLVPGLEPAIHDLSHWPGLAVKRLTKRRPRVSSISKAAPTNAEIFEDTEEEQFNGDYYDYLLGKYPPKGEDDDVLTLYGNSGDEDEYDPDTWFEIEQERREQVLDKNSSAMSKAKVQAVIDKAIKQIVAHWHEWRLPRTQLKGYRLWMNANDYQQRQTEFNNARYWFHRYDKTIEAMCEAITAETWLKATDVEKQCEILDEAVDQRETYRYFITILSTPKTPVRPGVETLKQKNRTSRADILGDEEVLESDSDLDGSVISDSTSNAGSIPHDAADSVHATRFIKPKESAAYQERIVLPPNRTEIASLHMVDGEVAQSITEEDQKPTTLRVAKHRTKDVLEPADTGNVSEGDIIFPTRKAKLPRLDIKHKVVEGPPGSAQDSDLDAIPTLPRSKHRPFRRTAIHPVDLTLSRSPAARTRLANLERSPDHQTQNGKLKAVSKKLKCEAGGKDRDSINGEADIIVLDTSDDYETSPELGEPPASSSIRKRKRKVLQSQEALSQQRSDQLRVQEEERRKTLANRRLATMDITGNELASHIIGFGKPQIFLDEHIGKRVMPHQVEGIQFMWREIMTDPKRQGCLLSHTMGLGKTMQVISLLVTIARSAKSDNIGIQNQVPEHLRETRALILCPPSLIDNWLDELTMWSPSPEVLGKLYKVQGGNPRSRLSQISQWAKEGGVLVLSYESLRGWILNEKKLSNEQHVQVEQDLLGSPTIVVADEAHKMKNAGAKITQVASRFTTTHRIALTGSPLANNLEEYHTMIDWIAPNYLGTIVQFRAKYSEPISQGLYEDSTSSDRRLSLRKLVTLGRTLEPKLNRADISAIEREMPSKTEFFITLPLTQLQIKAYNRFAQALLEGSGTNVPDNTKLWQWLHVLGLLCNHPLLFVNKLEEGKYGLKEKNKPGERPKMAATDESLGESLPADVVLSNIGLPPNEIENALKPFQQLDEKNRLEDPRLSNRTLIVQLIVAKSIEISDKVLIFSHTIRTLDYLQKMLDNIEGCNACRIDGETKMSTRQEATKVFNTKGSAVNVFLISMKAGGLGLNLQGANRVIIFDFSFNPTWEDQAIGRAYRLGQTKPVYVYRFRAGGTFEDVTYNKAVFKTTLFSRVVDKKNYMPQAKKSLSSYLFNVKDVEQGSLEDSRGKDRAVLDLIVPETNFIRNIELTETFQKEDCEKLSEEEISLAVKEYEDQQLQRDDPAAYACKRATNGTK